MFEVDLCAAFTFVSTIATSRIQTWLTTVNGEARGLSGGWDIEEVEVGVVGFSHRTWSVSPVSWETCSTPIISFHWLLFLKHIRRQFRICDIHL